MIHKVDYFSFTYYAYDKPTEIELRHLMTTLLSHLPEHITAPDLLEFAPARKGFKAGISIGNHTYCWINRTGLILIEHTGLGCQFLIAGGILQTVIASYAERCTRIDIASDILTAVMPADFVALSDQERATASGHQHSDTGETYYIGSRKSDRTCKVYRYFEPHPRSMFLRIEYTYRKEQAKVICKLMADGYSVADIAIRSGERYQWSHECYKPQTEVKLDEIRAWRPERREGKTVRWLYTQVLPSIARLHKDEILNANEFIDKIKDAIR